MANDRLRWNNKYLQEAYKLPRKPSALLAKNKSRLLKQSGKRALDLACGSGRNSLFLARLGFKVDAIDISDTGLRQLVQCARQENLKIRAIAMNLQQVILPRARYDVILNFNFLQRSLFAQIENALAPNGLLFFESFTERHMILQDKKMNPAYLLNNHELKSAFPTLEILCYRETDCAEKSKGARASLIACKKQTTS